NDLISADSDYNHPDEASREKWIAVCDSLSDKICQPTMHPIRPNVRTFLFYCYSPSWELPFNVRDKEFGLLYVGNSKFRWAAMSRVLQSIAPIRERVGRIGIVGHGWETLPAWAGPMNLEAAYVTDVDYMRRLGVEFLPPVPFAHVVCAMSKALLSPVL